MLARDIKQKMKSRMVLDDVQAAFDELRQVKTDRALFRRRWVTVITLLRTVGYVLGNVDRDRDPAHKEVIDDLWSQGKPPIFNDFIDRVRNLTVKEYRSRVFDIRHLSDNRMSIEAPGASAMAATSNDFGDFYEYLCDDLVFRDESFAQRPINDLIQEAIDWWDTYLSYIETAIANNS